MITLLTVIIILTCAVLAFFVLIQNPKGGGLSGSFGSMSSQIMGVKQSSDVMEKGTWYAMAIIAALCIVSVTFFEKPKRVKEPAKQAQTTQQPTNGAQQPAGK
ncbi:preprotein translocase subunit SecG [Rurimicrobium arvi]|uniref:Protein-export membrane protein SecG n=1 Tax=Rurimicrobium arvi TaxID=2049916 RepID=A0ABP8MTP1_9BACT